MTRADRGPGDGAREVEAAVAGAVAALDLDLPATGLLGRALTHGSWAYEHGRVPDNERLEFLGDAVLELAVTRMLLAALPDEPEGRLAPLRAHVVSEPSLAEVARGVGLGRFVLLGRGEAAAGGADRDALLADALEAVLGAVHEVAGWPAAERLVQRLLRPTVDAVLVDGLVLDHKSALKEWFDARGEPPPAYHATAAGPDHAPRFVVEARDAHGDVLGSGSGTSKKRAEKAAARSAWRALRARADGHGQ